MLVGDPPRRIFVVGDDEAFVSPHSLLSTSVSSQRFAGGRDPVGELYDAMIEGAPASRMQALNGGRKSHFEVRAGSCGRVAVPSPVPGIRQ